MAEDISKKMYRKFAEAGLALFIVLYVGTMGYWLISEQRYSVLDCLYMTFITISSIGYGEIVDMSNNPSGRVFTMFIALSGIGTLTYIFSNFTAFIVEGDLNEALRRRRMEKIIRKVSGHYIVCGIEGVGFHIVNELYATKRPYVIVDIDRKKMEKILQAFHIDAYIEGDATDNETLLKAGIEKATGLFAVSGDDNLNMVITLTAKQLNPNVKVVARSHELRNIDKMKTAGADAVVSPTFIGGLRMASEMVRPTVVSFLDIMLRDKEKALRIEELGVPETFINKPIASVRLSLKKLPQTLLLAVRTENDWHFNPGGDYVLKPEDELILMTNTDELAELKIMLPDSHKHT